MRLATSRWLYQVPACILLQSSFGAFYACGVFASRSPPLTSALGLASGFLSAAITTAGLALHASVARPRPLALIAAVLLAAQAVLPLASTLIALYTAAAALGVAYGILYVVSITVAQAWVPEQPGTATGAVVFAGGVGTLAYVAFNAVLAEWLGSVSRAMAAGAAVQCTVALIAASLISLPPSQMWHPDDDEYTSDTILGIDEEAAQTLLDPLAVKQHPQHPIDAMSEAMTVREMLLDPSFLTLLVTLVAGVGPGFGVVLHGARMQAVLFGVEYTVADRRFFLITLAGVMGRLVTGLGVDMYAAARSARLSAGSAAFAAGKAINSGLLALQTAALFAMIPLARTGHQGLFAVAIGAVYLTFSGTAVINACLCRSTFSPANTTLAFSLVGLAIGVGDVLFSALVSSCAEHGEFPGADITHEYDLFVLYSLGVSIVGLCASFFLKPTSRLFNPNNLGFRDTSVALSPLLSPRNSRPSHSQEVEHQEYLSVAAPKALSVDT
jgi:MFS family permease